MINVPGADGNGAQKPSQQTGATFASDGSIAGLAAGRDINIGSPSSINDLVLELQHLSLNGAFQRFRKIDLKAGVLGDLAVKDPRRASDLVERLFKADPAGAGQLIRQLDAAFAGKLMLLMRPSARADLMAAHGAPARIIGSMGPDDGAALLSDLARGDSGTAANVLAAFAITHRADYIRQMEPHLAARVLNTFPPADAEEIIDRLKTNDRNAAEVLLVEMRAIAESARRERLLRSKALAFMLVSGALLVLCVFLFATRGGGSAQPDAVVAGPQNPTSTVQPASSPSPEPALSIVPRGFPPDHLLRDDLAQWSDVCDSWLDEPEAKNNQVTRLIYSCQTAQGFWVVYTQYSSNVTPFSFGKPNQADAVGGSWTGPDQRRGTYLLYDRDPGRPGIWLQEAGTSHVAFMVWAPEKNSLNEQQLEVSLRELLQEHGYKLTS
ncbi:hypothetical protein ACGFIF_28955 [Kribbella sp. NPDC049174]|uniref:hypothetical protein n=1 Tax=Kribbella sp. NPDC049174 TaxID=3364112 RepID=UPI00371E8ECD